MAYKEIPKEYDLSSTFPTWIIAFCPDTDSWFATNQRFFYYEHPNEFADEPTAIAYFKGHISEFIKLDNELMGGMQYRPPVNENGVFFENTKEFIKP